MKTRLAVLLLALTLVPALARAEQTIGFVDMQRAVDEVEEGRAAKAVLQKEFDDRRKKLEAKAGELDRLQGEFEKQAVVMTETARQEKLLEIEKRKREFQMASLQAQKEISEREQELAGAIREKMGRIVSEIARDNGLTIVLQRAIAVITPPSLDITNELVLKYNTRHPAPGAPKKAAGKGAAKAGGKAAKGDAKGKSATKPEAKADAKPEAKEDAGAGADAKAEPAEEPKGAGGAPKE